MMQIWLKVLQKIFNVLTSLEFGLKDSIGEVVGIESDSNSDTFACFAIISWTNSRSTKLMYSATRDMLESSYEWPLLLKTNSWSKKIKITINTYVSRYMKHLKLMKHVYDKTIVINGIHYPTYK